MSVWYLLALLCSPWLLCRSPEVHKATWLDLCCPCLQPSGWIYAHHHLFIHLLYTWIIKKNHLWNETFKIHQSICFWSFTGSQNNCNNEFCCCQSAIFTCQLVNQSNFRLGYCVIFLTFSRAYVKIAFVLISHFRHLKKILVITIKVWCPSVVFKTHNTYMRNFLKK